MKNLTTGLVSLTVLALILGCGCRPDLTADNSLNSHPVAPATPANPKPAKRPQPSAKKA